MAVRAKNKAKAKEKIAWLERQQPEQESVKSIRSPDGIAHHAFAVKADFHIGYLNGTVCRVTRSVTGNWCREARNAIEGSESQGRRQRAGDGVSPDHKVGR
jgi:hypothetical protein